MHNAVTQISIDCARTGIPIYKTARVVRNDTVGLGSHPGHYIWIQRNGKSYNLQFSKFYATLLKSVFCFVKLNAVWFTRDKFVGVCFLIVKILESDYKIFKWILVFGKLFPAFFSLNTKVMVWRSLKYHFSINFKLSIIFYIYAFISRC